ncbi:MAG: TlpA family protein disulfide reductase [Winogradskyella sp.]|nr:TlpA family protein disulfide reductase [Winogradskyella sp.]
MKQILLVLLLSVLGCKNDIPKAQMAEKVAEIESESIVSSDFKLDIYDFDGLEPLINKQDEQVHIVNFWATWCAPCVKELPYFEAMNEKYKNFGLEVLLVSLDFPKNYDSKLKPFITKNSLKSKVVAFDDTDQNRWIPAIDESWSGAIPATIIYKGDKRTFYEQSFTQEELEIEILKFLE